MILRKTFIIENWKSWDHEIDSSTMAFYSQFSIYPNVLLANKTTLSRIDIIANKENIKGPNDEKPGKYEYVGIGSFRAEEYVLNICFDNKLPDKHISLIYDSDPDDDGGEPVPEEDTETKDTREYLANVA